MKTILVIEDFSGNRQLICRKLHGKGYHILTAATGRQAYELLTKPASDVSLVISNFDFQDVQEFDLLRRIKANPELENLPIVYLDCDLFSEGKKDEKKLRRPGFDEKSVRDDYFFREVSRAMQIRGSIVNLIN